MSVNSDKPRLVYSVYQPTSCHAPVENKSNVTTAANLLCPNTAMAHNIKYRHIEEYYYRALLERQTGKQRNDEHNALYHPSYSLNEGQRGMTASTKIPNAFFELLRCS
jgi:hypothetical protein